MIGTLCYNEERTTKTNIVMMGVNAKAKQKVYFESS